MLDFIGNALGAIASGGITGILGAGVSLFGEWKKQQMANMHKERMEELRQDAMELQMAMVREQGKIAVDVAEMGAFTASQKNDAASYSVGQELSSGQKWLMVFVDFMRGMIRPTMTIYMTVLTTVLYVQVMGLVGGLEGVITKTDALNLASQIILVILYITTTVILWWFGTRQKVLESPKISGVSRRV